MSWERFLDEAAKTKLNCRTFAAFNANIDVVIRPKPEDIQAVFRLHPDMLRVLADDGPFASPITSSEEFMALLKGCLRTGKSYYDVVDIRLSNWFYANFPERQEAMGGQAGIIANQMAALGAESLVYNPVLSPKQADIYDPRVKFPRVEQNLSWVPIREGVNDSWTKVNFIFEYPKGEVYLFGNERIVTPRANRIILGTRNPKAAMAFDPSIEPHLGELGAAVDVGFMAGYHHASLPGRAESLEEFISLSINQLKALRSKNSKLRLHFEYVPVKKGADEASLLLSIVPKFDSFGINENEICKVLGELGYSEIADDIKRNEQAYHIYKGALTLLRAFKISRIHVHNLGYYIVILDKPYSVPVEKVRRACLFASCVNGAKARLGGAVPLSEVPPLKQHALSDIGLTQLKEFQREAQAEGINLSNDFTQTGVLEREDHYMLLVPAHVIPNPVSTVGMGDTVSSSAYAAEFASARD